VNRVLIMVVAVAAIVTIAAAAIALNYQNNATNVSPSPTRSPSPALTATPSPLQAGTAGPTVAPTQTNTSAIITFTVEPKIKIETSNATQPGFGVDTSYSVEAYVSWPHDSYVSYYIIQYHFNGNPAPNQNIFGSGNFRQWGKPGEMETTYPHEENHNYYIGPPDKVFGLLQNNNDYLGSIGNFTGDDGYHLMGARDLFEPWSAYDNVNDTSMTLYEQQMNTFVQNYVTGWTVTVRPVS
jgi:hypothetical protein